MLTVRRAGGGEGTHVVVVSCEVWVIPSGNLPSAVHLTDVERRTLAELASNTGRVLTYEHLMGRVWRVEGDADLRPMRTVISSLRRKLCDDAKEPTYISTQFRVGHRMPKGESRGR